MNYASLVQSFGAAPGHHETTFGESLQTAGHFKGE
ncbi:unnamed protein product, partial [marine sediment metagenome]